MPIKTTNELGEEVDAYTADELEQQKQAAIDDYKAQNPDKSQDVQKLQTELEEAKNSLAGLRDKDINVGILRKGFEGKIEELEKTIDTKVNQVKESTKKEVMEGVMKDFYAEELGKMSSGDKELQKKIEYHYNRLSDAAVTKSELIKKLKDAYALSTMNEGGDMSVFSSGRVSTPTIKASEFNDADKDLLRKMGKGHLVK